MWRYTGLHVYITLKNCANKVTSSFYIQEKLKKKTNIFVVTYFFQTYRRNAGEKTILNEHACVYVEIRTMLNGEKRL